MTTAVARQLKLNEWESRFLPGLRLSARDQVVADALRQARRLDLRELRDGLSVEARGWIGVVQLDACTVCIEPRLIDGHRNLVALIDYVRRLDLLRRLDSATPFEAEGESLFDLMAWFLVDACDHVVKLGVQADYVPQHDELTMLRGRLDVRAQVLQRWGRLDRLVCDFEDRVRDIPENRWLLRALRVARRGVVSATVSTLVRRSAATWEELCEDHAEELIDRPLINRNNHHYRDALELAYLILDGVTASDLLQTGPAGGFSFMLNMPRLFEEFVSRAAEQLLSATGIQVVRQSSDKSVLWDVDGNQPFGHVRPDLLLVGDSGGFRRPVDAKYKDYGEEKLKPADMYQAAIYALALSKGMPGVGPRSCILIHPADTRTADVGRVEVRIDGRTEAEVVRCGVIVGVLLQELRDEVAGVECSRLLGALRP